MHRAGDHTELALMHISGDPSGRRYSSGPDAGRHALKCLVLQLADRDRIGRAAHPSEKLLLPSHPTGLLETAQLPLGFWYVIERLPI
jgi:hypothetical protein